MNRKFCCIILVLIMPLLAVLGYAGESAKPELVVSVPSEGYFDNGPAKYGIDAFLAAHPECSVKLIVQNDNALVQTADIYIVYNLAQDISRMLTDPRFTPLDGLISQDTRDNVFLLDKLINARGELVALPLFYKPYMLTLCHEFETRLMDMEYSYPAPETLQSWGAFYNWAADFPFDDPKVDYGLASGMPHIAGQINLMAQDINTGEIRFDTPKIRRLLEEWRTMVQNAPVHLNDPFTIEDIWFPADGLSLIEACRLISWFEETGVLPCISPLPYVDVNNSVPAVYIVGLIDANSLHKELAMALLESRISLDTQKEHPTAGSVRKDLMAYIWGRDQLNDAWIIDMKDWWGTPLTEEAYQNYLYTVEHSRIGIGTLQETLKSAQVVRDFCLEKITMEETLAKLTAILEAVKPS